MDRYFRSLAIWMAFRTESRIERSDDRQNMLMLATWMMDRYGSRQARFDCVAQWNRAESSKFAKRLEPGAPFDRAGHALRQQQPPRNDIPIPSVDDYIDILIQQVTFDDTDVHALVWSAWRRLGCLMF